MGSDKALVEVAGQPMIRWVVQALMGAGVEPIVAVGGSGLSLLEGLGVVPDLFDRAGPLAGIATALAWVAEHDCADHVVIAACDQVALRAETVSVMVESLSAAGDAAKGVVPVTPDGRIHPLPAVWRTSVADAMVELVRGGARRADSSFSLGVVAVEVGAESLVDLDTPDEVARFEKLLGRNLGPGDDLRPLF